MLQLSSSSILILIHCLHTEASSWFSWFPAGRIIPSRYCSSHLRSSPWFQVWPARDRFLQSPLTRLSCFFKTRQFRYFSIPSKADGYFHRRHASTISHLAFTAAWPQPFGSATPAYLTASLLVQPHQSSLLHLLCPQLPAPNPGLISLTPQLTIFHIEFLLGILMGSRESYESECRGAE
jgi:hypothetical protein